MKKKVYRLRPGGRPRQALAKVISHFKMSIASKESREVNYWLRLLRDSGLIKDKSFYDEVVDAIDESDQLKRILTKIVKTSQKNEKSKRFLSKPKS